MALRVRYAGADDETASLAAQYLFWFIPAMALQFDMVAMGVLKVRFLARGPATRLQRSRAPPEPGLDDGTICSCWSRDRTSAPSGSRADRRLA